MKCPAGLRLGALVAVLCACSSGRRFEGGELAQASAPTPSLEVQRLIASDGEVDDEFGASVGFSGSTALIGAPGDRDLVETVGAVSGSGAAYVFERVESAWIERQKLLASDGTGSESLGAAVAIAGDTAVVGAHADDDRGNNSGSAYVFVRNGASWIEQQKIKASDGVESDHFGLSVSLSGDTALVGSNRGAYVFVRAGTTWTEQQKLVPEADDTFGEFGDPVSVSGDAAVVHSHDPATSGAASIFVRSGAAWTKQEELVPGHANGWTFGLSVSLSGDTAVIGENDTEAAHVFLRSGTIWTLEQELSASDGSDGDRFGSEVSVTGNTILVTGAGAVYVFTRTGAIWTEQRKLVPPDGAGGFAASIANSSGAALVGAPGSGLGGTTGEAYYFRFGDEPDGSCFTDVDCARTEYCTLSGSCATRKPIGGSCNPGAGADCMESGCRVCEDPNGNGHCAGGVCCATACDGNCEACALALTGVPDGTCAPIPIDACGAGCASDADCPTGRRCEAGQCREPCSGNDCPQGDPCPAGSGPCEPSGSRSEGAGCGCFVGPSRPETDWWGIGLATLVLGLVRRLRRPVQSLPRAKLPASDAYHGRACRVPAPPRRSSGLRLCCTLISDRSVSPDCFARDLLLADAGR